MILVVDDDRSALEQLQRVLDEAGYDVTAFDTASGALDAAQHCEPALVLSDLVMPEMDGFAFRKAYLERFPDRTTPFVFLSSMSDESTIVEGLELGAHDYLTKPASPRVLVAKVRAILRRHLRPAETVFRGDLASLPFASVMRFCELKGLTGSVAVQSPSLQAEVRFRAGELQVEEGEDDGLGELCDLTEGSFTIRSLPAQFDDVEGISSEPPSSMAPARQPAGRLSTVQVGNRRVQVQTEVLGTGPARMVSLVTLDGKTLYKRTTDLPSGPERELQEAVDAHHHEVELHVVSRVEAARHKLTVQPAEDPRARFNRLFDEGYELYRAGEVAAAIERWEEAHQLSPDNATVRINLEVARSKLQK